MTHHRFSYAFRWRKILWKKIVQQKLQQVALFNEKQLQTITEVSPAAMVLIDVIARCVAVNPAADVA